LKDLAGLVFVMGLAVVVGVLAGHIDWDEEFLRGFCCVRDHFHFHDEMVSLRSVIDDYCCCFVEVSGNELWVERDGMVFVKVLFRMTELKLSLR
jgi:hypothetical protein